MICIKLQGGLGNQLFQYATALALADFHRTTVGFDLTFLKNQNLNQTYTLRRYALDIFNIPYQQLSIWDEILLSIRQVPFQHLTRKALSVGKRWSVYNEESIAYNADIQKHTTKNTYLTGYFQSEYYFKTIEPRLRDVLVFKVRIENELTEKIRKVHAVGLHIRRGDYASHRDTCNFHGLCSLQYYHKAAGFVAAMYPNLHFFVFSDDINWAKKHLALPFPTHFIQGTAAEDLQLMSLCKSHIIANSSFSWWGAWLNKSPEKMVIAPKRWFLNEKAESQSATLLPEKWIRI